MSDKSHGCGADLGGEKAAGLVNCARQGCLPLTELPECRSIIRSQVLSWDIQDGGQPLCHSHQLMVPEDTLHELVSHLPGSLHLQAVIAILLLA